MRIFKIAAAVLAFLFAAPVFAQDVTGTTTRDKDAGLGELVLGLDTRTYEETFVVLACHQKQTEITLSHRRVLRSGSGAYAEPIRLARYDSIGTFVPARGGKRAERIRIEFLGLTSGCDGVFRITRIPL